MQVFLKLGAKNGLNLLKLGAKNGLNLLNLGAKNGMKCLIRETQSFTFQSFLYHQLIKKNLLSCKDTREEKEFHPKYFSIYRKSSESIQKVRSRRNHLSEDDSKAA